MNNTANNTASSATNSTATPVEVLRRWERSGAVWEVVSRTDTTLQVSLMTCSRQEEVERLTSSDPELLAYVGTRTASDE